MKHTVSKKQRVRGGLLLSVFFIVTVLLTLMIRNLPYNEYSVDLTGVSVNYEIAKVTDVWTENLQESTLGDGLLVGSQTLQVEILTGEHRGQSVEASNALSTYNSVVMEEGKFVTVIYDELDSGQYQVRVYNYFRAGYIIFMALLFLGVLIFVGGKKGLMSSIGLAYTFYSVLFIFLPLVLRGYSPITAAIFLVVMVTSTTMVLLNGATLKSVCAIAGTVIGVVLSGGILFVFGKLMHVSGYSLDNAESLLLIGQTTGLQVQDLLFAGILIASLGAIMDVAISIVSAIHEFHVNLPKMKAGALAKSGINVGKDMIGTMSNTLILAFAGTSLSFLVLMYAYSIQTNQLLNMNTIAIEIVQALSGSLGIVLTVPITALITANVYAKVKTSK